MNNEIVNAKQADEKAEKLNQIFEIVVAILLGLTALITAWASYQGSLYDGNQSTKYTEGAAIQAEANAIYLSQSQLLASDMRIYDEMNNLQIDIAYAEANGDAVELEKLQWKYNEFQQNNCSEELLAAIEWAYAQPEYISPFAKEGFVDSYFAGYQELYDQGVAMVEDGKKDNDLSDKLGFSTVVFTLVLFLLGILNTFSSIKLKFVIMTISLAALVWATVVMLSVPLISL